MSKTAFSLVELAIVLVILGLLTGGILTGQSLIRAAELRSVTTEFQRYQTAVHTFRDKYFALPGDMRNATAFWGEMTNCGASGPSGTGTQTCNGDGDGQISENVANQTGENFLFWQHLANAGLIEGSYSGISGSGSSRDNDLGVNSPASKLNNAGWSVRYFDTSSASNSNSYQINYGNNFLFGSDDASFETFLPVLSPEEAWNIDKKIDDGLPAQGKIIAMYWNNLCAAADDGSHASNDFVASYRLNDSSIRCALYFRNAF
jgi:type II secretory pathway pseudopilin PulG